MDSDSKLEDEKDNNSNDTDIINLERTLGSIIGGDNMKENIKKMRSAAYNCLGLLA